MIRLIILMIISAGSILLPGRSASASSPLTLERTIPLEGVSGRIDHMAFDPVRNRLLIAELGNNSVDILDIKTGKTVHRIAGLEEPQGIAYLREPDLILIANGGDGTVSLFRAEDASPVAVIPLGADADNVRVDGNTGYALVGYGNGGLAIFDKKKQKKNRRYHAGSAPGSFRIVAKNRKGVYQCSGRRTDCGR